MKKKNFKVLFRSSNINNFDGCVFSAKYCF